MKISIPLKWKSSNWIRTRANLDVIHRIFRPFHTIKGVSGFLDLPQIHTVAHHAEDLLDQARGEIIVLGPREIDLIFEAVDLLKTLLETVENQIQGLAVENPTPVVNDFLKKIVRRRRRRGGSCSGRRSG